MSLKDKFYEWLAYKLPTKLCYFVYFRVHGFATSHCHGNKHPSETDWLQAIECWEAHAK